MRRDLWTMMIWGGLLLLGPLASAQDSLETLEQELNDAKQQHQEITEKTLANFFAQVDAAMASPEAALTLYQQAGGTLPTATPVNSQHENETFTEKSAREAIDQANLNRLGLVLQLHCGMMHYAALFIVKSDQPGLKDEWMDWLKSSSQLYLQSNPPVDPNDPTATNTEAARRKGNGRNGGPRTQPQPFDIGNIKGETMSGSLISRYLTFNLWGEKEQGKWAVRDLPKFYRANILEPLRKTPTPATLTAWDAYIAMANADETDNDRWAETDYPPLQFDRACDDYAITPSTEKLEGLIALIKANPTYPQVGEWITRTHQLMKDYKASHGGAVTTSTNPPPPAPTNNAPNVNITTTQQGDMTIITTHTNSAPAP